MANSDMDTERSGPPASKPEQAVIDKLVFAALKEQVRARRWGVFFKLFFVGYICFITIMALVGGDRTEQADGDRHTAVLKLTGIIAEGKAAGSDTIIPGLRAAFKHEDTAGIVIEINSPGGTPVQSAYIFDEIKRLKELHQDMPVYAVVGDMAASGGYFVAAAADTILVNKSSLVGSIGVRMDAFGFVDLMDKIGVERRLLTAGENKGIFDPFLPENTDQTAHLQAMLDDVHGHFIAAVKQGRGDRLVENEDIFSGLIWSGEQSLKLGLADGYGTTYSVARDLDAEELVNFTPKASPLEWIFDLIGSRIGDSIRNYMTYSLST